MAKFNTPYVKPAVRGIIQTSQVSTLSTYEGAPAYVRDAKSELFLLAVSNMVGEDTFYESGADRDKRYIALISQVAIEDFDWLFNMLVWLRAGGNMRSAPLMGAVEAVRARLAHAGHQATHHNGGPAESLTGRTNRALIAAVCQRADEPGELLSYYISRYGKKIPMPIKRGVADAAVRLYNEKSLLKYDSERKGLSFGDVIELTHAKTSADWQNDLYRYSMDKHGAGKILEYGGPSNIVRAPKEIPESLRVLIRRDQLMKKDWDYARKVTFLKSVTYPQGNAAITEAGLTWESVAGWLQGPMTAEVWEAIIPSMGYMALIRNLRNFDEAGISDDVAAKICAKISDPDEVVKSRQFPFRFWSAYKNAPSLRWANALDKALSLSLSNLPVLDESLIVVDTSASMTGSKMSAKSAITASVASAIFGVSLAAKPGNDKTNLVAFADHSYEFHVAKGASALKYMEGFIHENGKVGYGTQLISAIHQHFVPGKHKRVIVISDMQIFNGGHFGRVEDSVPANVPLYAFNISGYKPAMMLTSSNRIELGGLTDATFTQIPLMESGRDGKFPWEMVG